MVFKDAATVAVHLLHIGTLAGCGHLISIGCLGEALVSAVCGGLCVVTLTALDIFANWLRGRLDKS